MNEALFAVAGSGKTQSIVQRHKMAQGRTLFITFTTNNQDEMQRRLDAQDASNSHEIQGWYQFLISNFLKPYIHHFGKGVQRYRGFNFEYRAGKFDRGARKFFDAEGRVGKEKLAYVARIICENSGGKPIRRLEEIYDEIVIDEVQDLAGSDLDILEALFCSKLDVYVVGDFRQAVYATNSQDTKHKKYRGMKALDWYRAKEEQGLVNISFDNQNRRSDERIVLLANRIFDPALGLPNAVGSRYSDSDLPGIHHVSDLEAVEYVRKFSPMCLRNDRKSAKKWEMQFQFHNFRKVKGLTVDRVLIVPTKPIEKFLKTGEPMENEHSAASLYVAMTRARFSVAFLLPESFTFAKDFQDLIDQSPEY